MKREKLSALVDGELNESDMQAVTRELADAETLAQMELYYRIGEELRADSVKVSLSPEFPAKMAAALAAETPHEAKTSEKPEKSRTETELSGQPELDGQQSEGGAKQAGKQFVPGLVAMVAVVAMASHHLIFILQTNSFGPLVS